MTSSTSTTTTTSTTIPSTTTTEATTTTSTAPPLPATANPPCVVAINPGDTLEVIVAAVANDTVSVESLQAENEIVDPASIAPGGFLDICIGNAMNDVSGEQRVPPTTVPPALAGVQAQQQKLNELFAGYGLPPLAVDGDSGSLTEQQLCAARMALNLPISRADIEPGSPEEQAADGGQLPVDPRRRAGRGRALDPDRQDVPDHVRR